MQSERVNAVMLTCGTYDAAGEFACRVGPPGKSSGIVAIVPGRGSITVWGPALGPNGNSVAGIAALGELTARIGWFIFEFFIFQSGSCRVQSPSRWREALTVAGRAQQGSRRRTLIGWN